MYTLCFGCMKIKQEHPKCELCGFDENKQNGNHQLPLGTIVGGQYILGRVLGQGGFGITYLAWDRFMSRTVAVKEYFPSGYAGRDSRNPLHVTSYDNHDSHDFENNKKRFLREAESLARLWTVPQIVKILRHFEDNGTAYIAMEYVEGVDLNKYLKKHRGPLTMEETMTILAPVMEGLSHVHRAGLVHRDISPDNIMVLPDGSAKLLDFGAARYVENADAEKDRNTSTQAILKHGYAPPEQYRTHGALGPWTDIYAMCATIYYCLTGKVPPEAMGRTMEGEQIDWDKVPGLTAGQRAALNKGMEILPKNRFASIEELRAALIRDLAAPVKTQLETSAQERTSLQKKESAGAGKTQPEKRKKKRHPVLATMLLVLLVIAGFGLHTLQYEIFTYETAKDGATITGLAVDWYCPARLNIPARIDGHPVTAIGKNAFAGCTELETVTLPASVKIIGNSAFKDCSGLVSISIPAGVDTIGNYAFENCTGLTEISIPSDVKTIGPYAFLNCSGLTRVNLPDSLRRIGKGAFQNCTGLTGIVIPKGITYLEDYTFYRCSGLTSVHLPEGIRYIEDYAFYKCTALTAVNIPGSVTEIGNSAFSLCSSLQNVTLPGHLETIGSHAFNRCTMLKIVSIPQFVESIGNYAFHDCPKLDEVSVPHSCQIGADAFPATCKVNYYW